MTKNKNPPGLVRPKTSWGISRSIEDRYFRSLRNLYRAIIRQLRGATTLTEIRTRLATIQASADFHAFARNMAANMAAQVTRLSGANWRKRAEEANNIRSREIFRSLANELANSSVNKAIADMVKWNAKLIVTLPSRVDNEITTMLAKEYALGGIRHEQLTKELFAKYGTYTPDWDIRQDQLDKFGNDYRFTEGDARRIARTEVSKAQCALTQARADDLGLKWYVWKTANDGDRVREAHQKMQNVLVNWADPPDPEEINGDKHRSKFGPYHAGNIYNCRCYPEPLIDVDWLDWNVKQPVHMGGQIARLTRQEFLPWFNI